MCANLGVCHKGDFFCELLVQVFCTVSYTQTFVSLLLTALTKYQQKTSWNKH